MLAGCGTSGPTDDELDGESAADGEAGKGDAAGAFTYFTVAPDTRQCSLNSPAGCGTGYFAARANRTTTQCGRGLPQSSCKVDTIDWTGTAMPTSVWMNYAGLLADGEPMVLRGEIVPAANDAGLTLAVTEIWRADKPESADGVFTLVKDNGIRCITAPCPSLGEQKLNSNLSASIEDLDFEPSGADAEAVNRAYEHVYDDGLIVVGYRYYDGSGGKGRTVNKYYTKAAVPQF